MIVPIVIAGTAAFAIYRIVTQEKIVKERPRTGTEEILGMADGIIGGIADLAKGLVDLVDDAFARRESLQYIAAIIAKRKLENATPAEVYRSMLAHRTSHGRLSQDAVTMTNGIASEYFERGYTAIEDNRPGTELFTRKKFTYKVISGGSGGWASRERTYYDLLPDREDTFNSVFKHIASKEKYQPVYAKVKNRGSVKWFTPEKNYIDNDGDWASDAWYFKKSHSTKMGSTKGLVHCFQPGEHHMYTRTVQVNNSGEIISGDTHRVQGWYQREAEMAQLMFFAPAREVLWGFYK